MPFDPAQWFTGIGKQTVDGTGVAPSSTGWVPIAPPDIVDNIAMLEDKGNRGSMVEVYNLVQGTKFAEITMQGQVFADVIPNFLQGIFGGMDAVGGVAVSGGGALLTTLSSAAAAAATTYVTVGQPTVGMILQVNSQAGRESRTITAVSGTGPYTATFVDQLLIAHPSGSPITAIQSPFNHNFSLLNNAAATSNQPPSYSITVFNGYNARRFIDCKFSEVSFKWTADGMLEFTAKAIGVPSAVVTTPTSAFGTQLPLAGWTNDNTIATVANALIMGGEISLRRPVKAEFTGTGIQTPYAIHAGPLSMDGKCTFVYESDTELGYYLNNTQPAMTIEFNPTSTLGGLRFRFTQAAFKTGKVSAGSELSTLEADFMPVPNTTDAYNGGLSPSLVTVWNTLLAAY